MSARKSALDVVARRPASARVPGLRLGRRRGRRRRRRSSASSARPASWRTSRRRWSKRTAGPDARHDGHRAHPLGHARRPQRQQRPPAPRLHRSARRDPQRHHRELRRAAGRAGAPRPRARAATPTPRSSRTCSRSSWRQLERSADSAADLAEALRRVCRQLDGAFTLVVVDRDEPGRRRRRAAQLAARRRARRRRDVPRQRRRRLHRPHPRRARDSARTRSSSCARDRRRPSPTSTASPSDGDAVPRRLGRQRRREGRLPVLHAQGDRRAAAGAGRHAARPARPRAATSCSTRSGSTTRSCGTSTRSFIVACGTAYHAGLIAKYAIEHWTRLPCEVELASEFRYRDPILDRGTLVIAISQSGETLDTLDGRPARP